jgi:spore germination protein GerM
MTRAATRCALFVSAVLVVFLAGCGVPIDRAPAVLTKGDIPFHLLDPSSRSPTSVTPLKPSAVAVQVFFLASTGDLVSVQRLLPSDDQTLAAVLSLLVAGPTPEEAAQGLGSAIPPQTTVLGATVTSGGLATVDMGGTFSQLVGAAQIQAVAQIVFTAMTMRGPNVTGVTFQLAGQAIEVPTETGAQIPVVNESAFANLAPAQSNPNATP